ncbi:MAG: superoxide dismutase [Rhizobiales bacterium]|nr:superoxide dismutase [Hyphomicrobiales bacterium]
MAQFSLPELPYAYDALAPHMSAETLEYHHDKHHKTYVDKANDLVSGTDLEGKSLEEVVKGAHQNHQALFNNAAQHFNHLHFWQWMTPNGGGRPPEAIGSALDTSFGSFDRFKEKFVETGAGQFGSGWVWLAWRNDGLEVMGTPNGENPLVHGGIPLLGCDVWEHSYYIDYRNRRPDYLKAFIEHLVNWEHVKEQFAAVS